MGDTTKYSKFFSKNNEQKEQPKQEAKKDDREEIIWFTGEVHNCEILNCREKPNLEANILGKYKKGDELTISDYNREWYMIKRKEDGKIGYSMKDYIKAVN